ncbi:MAG: ABC transporter permease [Actinomycetota bacterium]|nr:ABC transporter permease [Actinomycetota bacterium]
MSSGAVADAGVVEPEPLHPLEEEEEARPPSAWRTIVGSLEGRIGLALGVVMLALIAFGRFFAPYEPTEQLVGPQTTGPSGDHLLGTDNLGRDVFSRFLAGGDTIVLVPLAAVALAFVAGGGLGMLGAYARGRIDTLITRGFDLLLTLPPLLLVLVIIAGVGTSNLVLIVTVALVFLPRVGRVLRGATQAVVTNDYVAAAQARGERTWAILVREVLPNIAAPAIADFALRITYGVIFVATLNFLGLGAQPPEPDWGLMVAESRNFLSVAPWATLAPALGIAALSISFNLIADALTRHLTREAARGVVPV